ncbi:DNA-directed RNA polymerase I subunit RPA1 [Nematocida sp. AWRm77]|nr:DNA-directed RNA polymerase I subunit RPA1 [Nematocida sp. AWRm77]
MGHEEKPLLFGMDGLQMRMYSPEEIREESVVHVIDPGDFDELGHPVKNSVCDLRMGALREYPCGTCSLGEKFCPGHFGHIDLPLPLYNPLTYDVFLKLLRQVCMQCKKLKAGKMQTLRTYTQLVLADKGMCRESMEAEHADVQDQKHFTDLLEEAETRRCTDEGAEETARIVKGFFARVPRHCMWCGALPQKIEGSDLKVFVERTVTTKEGETCRKEELLFPLEGVALLQEVCANEEPVLGMVFKTMHEKKTGPNFLLPLFFLEVLAVTPAPFRPLNYTGGVQQLNPRSSQYRRIIQHVQGIFHMEKSKAELAQSYMALQAEVKSLYTSGGREEGAAKGVKELLEKKEGLIRRHMMGKRVNYIMRSVISPDPTIAANEVGIPEAFAREITFPVPVSDTTAEELKRAVENGPVYPGAEFVEDTRGRLINLHYMPAEKRKHISRELQTFPHSTAHAAAQAPEEKYAERVVAEREAPAGVRRVWRHMRDGDYVLVNRQPSLHKVSMMGHKVKILKGEKTIRIHYVNCNSYNADFDGDEMNVHYPQDIVAQIEAAEICSTDQCYISATNGSPVRGHVQDHIVMGAVLSQNNVFLKRDVFHQLVVAPLFREKIVLPPPAVLRPVQMYTGKQAISTVIANTGVAVTLEQKSKLGDVVRICRGELLTGTFDKAQIGASSFGLVHAANEMHGGAVANTLLTSLGKMLNRALHVFGYSCTMEDLAIQEDAEQHRHGEIERGSVRGAEAGEKFLEEHPAYMAETAMAVGKAEFPEKKKDLDSKIREVTGEISSQVLDIATHGLAVQRAANRIYMMVASGAKGSLVNLGQIISMLGQQELEGMRVPLMCTGRTLPTFSPLEQGLRAGGFISQRFLTGVHAEEFYFHCMAGREGLIDTAVKTSRSGYLQRCLIKHLEGISLDVDGSVKDSEGTVLQMVYGEDGIHPEKSAYLHKHAFFAENPHRHTEEVGRLGHVSALVGGDLYNLRRMLGKVSEKYLRSLPEEADVQEAWARYLQSTAEPGESVGILAAQSVGEPSTQMTLNTFHLAGVGGKNVTLGLPRLNEIVMHATKEIKTPVITAPSRKGVSPGEIELLTLAGRKNVLSVIRSITLQEIEITDPRAVRLLRVQIEPQVGYLDALAHTLKQTFFTLFSKDIKAFTKSLYEQKIEEKDVHAKEQRGAQEASAKDGEEALDEGEEKSDDGDTSSSSTASSTSSSTPSRDGEKEKEKEADVSEGEKDEGDEEKEKEKDASEGEEALAQMFGREDAAFLGAPGTGRSTMYEEQSCTIDESRKYVTLVVHVPLSFRTVYLARIESVLKKMDLESSVQYNECAYAKGQFIVQAKTLYSLCDAVQGTAIQDVLDVYSAQSNSIWDVLETLGIEAARSAIIREIKAVFEVYGITIDYRHLSVIADYMTSLGTISPFNRMTFQKKGSPLQKVSYESAYTFIKSMVLSGHADRLRNPSSCITVGKPIPIGTSLSSFGYGL